MKTLINECGQATFIAKVRDHFTKDGIRMELKLEKDFKIHSRGCISAGMLRWFGNLAKISYGPFRMHTFQSLCSMAISLPQKKFFEFTVLSVPSIFRV